MTAKNVTISPELFARVTEEAAAEGTTADEIANEAMKRYLALDSLIGSGATGTSAPRNWASPRMTFLA